MQLSRKSLAEQFFVIGLGLAIVLGLGFTIQESEPPATQPNETEKTETSEETKAKEDDRPQRVILQIGRYDSARGTVQSEDDLLIVIENEAGKIESYPKSRIIHITRLTYPAENQRGDVVLVDGTVRTGVVVEDSFDRVVIEIEGIRTRFERAIVDHVKLHPTIEEQYHEFKKAMRPEQYIQRLELCYWLVDEKKYDLALQELELLEKEKPGLQGLAPLLRMVRAQIAMEESADERENQPTDTTGDAGDQPTEERTGPVREADVLPSELITKEDVNLIRVYEIDFNKPPRVRIEPDTIRTLIENYASHDAIPTSADARSALFRAEPLDVVKLIFDVKARDLYPQIQVVTEPYSLNLFKQRVHNTWLINNCATSACHGGLHGGRLFLHGRNYKADRVRYTNLLILDRLELDPDKPLINYAEPLMSKVIQHALPRAEARDPHPDVRGWKPVFNRNNLPLLQDSLEWIESMYANPRPNYPVEYDPPMLIVEDPGNGLARPDSEPGRPDR